MKYTPRYNAHLGKVTYRKKRTNYSGLWMLLSFVLFTLCAYLIGQIRVYEQSSTILVSPVPQDYFIRTGSPTARDLNVQPLPTAIPTQAPQKMSDRTLGCIRNHPDVAQKLKDTFENDFAKVADLVCRESSFNPAAENPNGGALGLFQRYPAKTLTDDCPDLGLECQILNGQRYLENRYKTVDKALAFWDENGWY